MDTVCLLIWIMRFTTLEVVPPYFYTIYQFLTYNHYSLWTYCSSCDPQCFINWWHYFPFNFVLRFGNTLNSNLPCYHLIVMNKCLYVLRWRTIWGGMRYTWLTRKQRRILNLYIISEINFRYIKYKALLFGLALVTFLFYFNVCNLGWVKTIIPKPKLVFFV